MAERNTSSSTVKQKLIEKLRRKREAQCEAAAHIDIQEEPPVQATRNCSKLDIIETAIRKKKLLDVVLSPRQQLKDGDVYLEVKRKFPDIVDPKNGGPLQFSRAVILSNGTAVFQVLLKPHWTVNLFENESLNVDALENLLNLFSSHHYFCVGMSPTEFRQISSAIHINLKNMECHKTPFERVASNKCQVWFKAAKNISKVEKETGAVCQECKSFFRYVKRMNSRNAHKSKASLQKRLEVSSNFKISKLTPRSQKRRLKRASINREELKRKLKLYEEKMTEYHITLDNNQNDEMEQIVRWINKNAVNDMETLLVDGDGDISDIMRETWNKDTMDRGQFYRDQFCNKGKFTKLQVIIRHIFLCKKLRIWPGI